MQHPRRKLSKSFQRGCLASGSFLIPSMICILALLLVLRKPIEQADKTEEVAP